MGAIHRHVRVDARVPHILSNAVTEDRSILSRPFVGARQRRQANRLNSVCEVVIVPLSYFLVTRVLRPRIAWPLVDLNGDVFEPDLGQNVFQRRDVDEGLPKDHARFSDQRAKLR